MMRGGRRGLLTASLSLALLNCVVLAGMPGASRASGLARVGDPAPAFSLRSIDGRSVSLSNFAGKFVVLEWWNSDCYAINTHYEAGTIQEAQKAARGSDVVWLSIDSTHASHPSFVEAKQASAMLRKWSAAPTAMLQDPDGRVGRLYDARVTPHTYVIDPKGRLIYAGAFDDDRSMRNVRKANNLALAAIKEARSGRPVTRPLTQAYG